MKYAVGIIVVVAGVALGWLAVANRETFRIGGSLARVAFEVRPPTAHVYVDNKPHTPTATYATGEHTVSAYAEGYRPFEKRVRFRAPSTTVTITLEPESSYLPPEGAPTSP